MKFVASVKVGDRVKVEGYSHYGVLADATPYKVTAASPKDSLVTLNHREVVHLRNIVEIVECGEGNHEWGVDHCGCESAFCKVPYHCYQYEPHKRGPECRTTRRLKSHESETGSSPEKATIPHYACTRCGKKEEPKPGTWRGKDCCKFDNNPRLCSHAVEVYRASEGWSKDTRTRDEKFAVGREAKAFGYGRTDEGAPVGVSMFWGDVVLIRDKKTADGFVGIANPRLNAVLKNIIHERNLDVIDRRKK